MKILDTSSWLVKYITLSSDKLLLVLSKDRDQRPSQNYVISLFKVHSEIPVIHLLKFIASALKCPEF